MAGVSSKALILIGFLCVHIYGIKGRPNNFDDVTAAKDQNKFEESELLKASKTYGGGQDKGMNLISHTNLRKFKKMIHRLQLVWRLMSLRHLQAISFTKKLYRINKMVADIVIVYKASQSRLIFRYYTSYKIKQG